MAVTKPEPARRRRRPEEAEREILDAAERLLRERPSHEVTVSEIMAATTLSRKSFYVYFRDRHDLIARLVQPLRAQADEAMAAWQPSGDGGRTALLEVARLYMRHGPLLRALAEASRQDPEAARVWREFTEPPIAAAAERIRRGIELGNIAPLDAEATARALIGMNLTAIFEQLVDRPDADPEPVVDALVEIWRRTLSRATAPAASPESPS